MLALKRVQVIIIASLLGISSLAEAKNYYRYKTEHGKTVISQILPIGAEMYGYEVVNDLGIVIEVVEAPVPPEELKKDAKLAAKVRKQQEEDAALLRLYADASDAKRARDRQVDALSLKIQYTQTSVANLDKKLKNLLSQAADIERAGRDVPENLLEEIDMVQGQLNSSQSEISQFEKEKQLAIEEFEPIITRLDEIAIEKANAKQKALAR